MPRIRKTETMTIAEYRAEFFSDSEWKRRKNGNLTRQWDGKTLTIFERGGGYIHWCIGDGFRKPKYSHTGFEDEEDAMCDLADFILDV